MADRGEAEAGRARHRRGEPETIGAQEARQGRVVLDTPVRRWVFFSGLVGLVVLAFLVAALF